MSRVQSSRSRAGVVAGPLRGEAGNDEAFPSNQERRAPRELVAGLYERWPQGRTFEEDIAAHLATGYVVDAAEFFIMGRAVDRRAAAEEIADPWRAVPRERQNAWLVYAFAGSSRNFLAFVPYRLRWIGFQRRGKGVRFYEFGDVVRRCGKGKCSVFSGTTRHGGGWGDHRKQPVLLNTEN